VPQCPSQPPHAHDTPVAVPSASTVECVHGFTVCRLRSEARGNTTRRIQRVSNLRGDSASADTQTRSCNKRTLLPPHATESTLSLTYTGTRTCTRPHLTHHGTFKHAHLTLHGEALGYTERTHTRRREGVRSEHGERRVDQSDSPKAISPPVAHSTSSVLSSHSMIGSASAYVYPHVQCTHLAPV